MRIEPSGAVNASVGLMATGQGYETALAQAVADGLGVDAGAVRIQLGNTDVAPYGMGSRGARGATAGGGALYLCAGKARERVLAIATAMLQLNSPAELRMVDGVIERRIEGKWTDTGVTLGSVARTAYLDPGALPEGVPPGLDFSLTLRSAADDLFEFDARLCLLKCTSIPAGSALSDIWSLKIAAPCSIQF